MQGRERVRTLSVQSTQPHTTNPWNEEKGKTVGDKNTMCSIAWSIEGNNKLNYYYYTNKIIFKYDHNAY